MGAVVKPVVFIHTNDKQMLGARVGAYLLETRSPKPDAFEIRLLRLEETPHLYRRQGQSYLRKGKLAVWRNEDLQSFSPLRMLVPQMMNYEGRALVLDPDVFAIGDVCEILESDMEGKAIRCRRISEGYRGNGNAFHASSVMVLDCARLRHWRWDEQIDALFTRRLDYGPWIALELEDPTSIGELAREWNDFDRLAPETRLLHNTERLTQPWKTGLRVDFDLTTAQRARPFGWVHAKLSDWGLMDERAARPRRYLPHPDPAQERFFLEAVRECLSVGVFDEAFLKSEIEKLHVRTDLLERIRALGRSRPQTPLLAGRHA